MRENILLTKIKKNYSKGNKDKCIKLINKYFFKHYNIEKLMSLPILKSFLIDNVDLYANSIISNYSEQEISILKKYDLLKVIQRLLDLDWGNIHKVVLFKYVPELINYDNLKSISYNNLHDLYEKENNNDILHRFNDDVNAEMGFDLYSKRKGQINNNIKKIIFIKFYKDDKYVTYFNNLVSEEDKALFIRLILSRKDSSSVERAYEIYLLTNNPLLFDHIKKYDTGKYIYYLLISGKKFPKEENKKLVDLLDKCEDTQYRYFYVAYSYSNNSNKLSNQMFTTVGGITLFFDVLREKCTNIEEFIKIKSLYKNALKHDAEILGQKFESVEINKDFDFNRYNDSNEALNTIYNSSSFKITKPKNNSVKG